MLATTATGTRVAARYHQTEKERRVNARADRLNLMFVNALRTALYAAKKGEARHPYPEPRGSYSEVLRTHAQPLARFGSMVAGLVEDGMDAADARVLCAVVTEWIAAETSGDMPPLSQLTPRLAIENGEAVAAAATAMHMPSRSNLERALAEAQQARAVQDIHIACLARERRLGGER